MTNKGTIIVFLLYLVLLSFHPPSPLPLSVPTCISCVIVISPFPLSPPPFPSPSLYLCSDIIKLTAQFVARNGAQFMDQLMVREQKNETFDFLRKNHILFTFFTKMVEQYSKVGVYRWVCMKSLHCSHTLYTYMDVLWIMDIWSQKKMSSIFISIYEFMHIIMKINNQWLLLYSVTS